MNNNIKKYIDEELEIDTVNKFKSKKKIKTCKKCLQKKKLYLHGLCLECYTNRNTE